MPGKVGNLQASKAQLWRMALVRHGVWWWANDTDNPFGHAFLTCPRISATKKMGSMVYLYTIVEASAWTFPKLIAKERCSSSLSKIGWVIHRGKTVTDWTLPDRFTPNVTAKLIRKRTLKYNKGLRK